MMTHVSIHATYSMLWTSCNWYLWEFVILENVKFSHPVQRTAYYQQFCKIRPVRFCAPIQHTSRFPPRQRRRAPAHISSPADPVPSSMVLSAPLCHGVLPFPVAVRASSACSGTRRLVLAAGRRSGSTAFAATDAALLADPARVGRRRYS